MDCDLIIDVPKNGKTQRYIGITEKWWIVTLFNCFLRKSGDCVHYFGLILDKSGGLFTKCSVEQKLVLCKSPH